MKVKYIILIVFLMIALTGCTKSELNMNIDLNGDVSLVHKVLVNDSDFDYISNIIKEDRENFEYKNYSIKKITENGMTGYKISSTIGNIRDISKNKKEEIELSEYASDNFNNNLLFTDIKGLFTNKYVGKYTVDLTNLDKAVMYLPIFNGSVYSSSGDKNNSGGLLTSEDIEKLDKETATTFVLNSKIDIGENNATKHENDQYIWELKYGKVNEIYFEVNRINESSLITGCVFILAVGLYYIVTGIKKKRLKAYNSVTLRESLDLEYRIEKKNQIKDIRLKRRFDKKNEINEEDAYSINERVGNTSTSIGAYSNQETIEKLNSRIVGNNSKKEIVPLSEQKDPEFKSVNSQVIDTIEKVKEDNTKFLDNEDK